jgi:XRE family aerobic/anaerobic benzoate catabolism transcriptional regulator
MEPLLTRLGERVHAARTRRGLTLLELGRAAGLSPRFLGQVESGLGNISVLRLEALARALGTGASALLAAARPGGDATPTIALLGLRGAGKTSVGRKLARRLELPFVELDRRIEEAAGLTIAEIFALHGEGYYRRLERVALDRVLAEGPQVLATGGGIVASPSTYSRLRRRTLCVWLRASPEDHWNRVVQQGDRRPMADHPRAMAELRRLLQSRGPLYARAAHVEETSGRSPEQVVDAVAAFVERRVARGRGRSSRRTRD